MSQRKPFKKHGNIHHIHPRSKAYEGIDVDKDLNKKRIDERFHERLHQLFGNMSPQEQLRLLTLLNWPVLSQEVRDRLLEVFALPPERFYVKQILSGKTPRYPKYQALDDSDDEEGER